MLLQNRVHVLSFIQGDKVVYIRKIHPYELILYTCLFSIGSTSSITEIRMTFPCNPCLLLRSVSAEVITKGSSSLVDVSNERIASPLFRIYDQSWLDKEFRLNIRVKLCILMKRSSNLKFNLGCYLRLS